MLDNKRDSRALLPGVPSPDKRVRVSIWGGFRHLKSLLPQTGTVGHLALFLWALGMALLVPISRLPLATGLVLTTVIWLYPGSLKHILRVRNLILLALLALPPIFFLGEADTLVLGVPVSQHGLETAMQIALRFLVILTAVDGLTRSVEISALAGLLERFGLQGLGFSLGVALNLLPALRASAGNAWQSLWMRGGLRKRRWRGMQLLFTTVLANALRRAESISLAAEARAFSPDKARPMPVEFRLADWWAVVWALGTLAGALLLP